MATVSPRSESSKRRRISPPGSIGIDALPHALLVDVASYLSKPSQAMFAVAMTAHASSWNWKRQPSAASRAIISTPSSDHWAVLDFGDIEKTLAAKLTDDDIGAILVCINAKNTIKRLMLAGCVNITGHGLGPLHGSVRIEQIDLSLTGEHESPNLDTEPSMSETVVLPVLESIIATNAFKHLHLPVTWRKDGRCVEMGQFLSRCNQRLERRNGCCKKCGSSIGETSGHEHCGWIWTSGTWYGLQNHTCHQCLNIFCSECYVDGSPEEHCYLHYCEWCQREYCNECVPSEYCQTCSSQFCPECANMKQCERCEESLCSNCHPDDECACWQGRVYCQECAPARFHCERDGCEKNGCAECSDAYKCNDCKKSFCIECKIIAGSKGELSDCFQCLKMIVPKLAEESNKQRKEIRDLKQKNLDLTKKLEGEQKSS